MKNKIFLFLFVGVMLIGSVIAGIITSLPVEDTTINLKESSCDSIINQNYDILEMSESYTEDNYKTLCFDFNNAVAICYPNPIETQDKEELLKLRNEAITNFLNEKCAEIQEQNNKQQATKEYVLGKGEITIK